MLKGAHKLAKKKRRKENPLVPRHLIEMMIREVKLMMTSCKTDLQWLQVSLLRVAEQRGDAMAVPHAVHAAVPPQWKNLTDDRHPSQSAVGQLHDLSVADLLRKQRRQTCRQILLLTLLLKLISWLKKITKWFQKTAEENRRRKKVGDFIHKMNSY